MAHRKLSDRELTTQIRAAKRRSILAREGRVRALRCHVANGKLTVTLSNGATLAIPVRAIAAIARASKEDLARVTVDSPGLGLHWDRLDFDVSVAALAAMTLGKANLMAVAGSAGGRARSDAKARAARKNGSKGGRPRTKFVA